MPGTRCTVAVCNNSFEKTKRAGMNIMYHQFPKTQPLRNIWIQRCRRAGTWNPNSCHICSIHFTADDYKRDMSSEFLNIPGKRRLKSTAVPSLFLTVPPPLGLMSLSQRKRKKVSVDNEQSIYINNEEAIFLELDDVNNQDRSTDDLPIYEICKMEDPKDEKIMFLSQYENYHIDPNITENLDSYYVEKNESEKADEKEEKISSSRFQYTTVKDRSTQTDTDYILENFKQLVDKNESLESEIVRWVSKYKSLMSNVRFLESEIQRLTINSNQAE